MKQSLSLVLFAAATIGGLACGSGSSGSGLTQSTCNNTGDKICLISTIPASSVTAYKEACTKGGGSPVSNCPSANLDGCCTISSPNGTVESCGYDGSLNQPDCEAGGGVWSATP